MPKEFSTPGPRAIYPEMCASRSLGACGLVANVIWPRLISIADDQGRIAGDATDVLLVVLPNLRRLIKHRDVEVALGELAKARQIRLYVVDEEPYIQILTWWSWQHGMRRAYPSRHPAPARWTDYVYGYPGARFATFREAGGFPQRARLAADDAEGAVENPPREPRNPGPPTAVAPEGAVQDGSAQPQPAVENTPPEPQPAVGQTEVAVENDVADRNFLAQPRAHAGAQPRVPRARPVPGPARPGRAGPESPEDDSTLKPGEARTRGNDPSENGSTTGPRLTAAQRAAWRSYDRVQWAPFRSAWLARGFPWPPGGDPSDDPEDSVRARLWVIAQDDPTGLGRLVAEAPAGSRPHQVVGHVFARWNAGRAEAIDKADDADAEWERTKAEDRAAAGRALAAIGAGGTPDDGPGLDFGDGGAA